MGAVNPWKGGPSGLVFGYSEQDWQLLLYTCMTYGMAGYSCAPCVVRGKEIVEG